MTDVYLDSSATGAADGTTWADAYTTLAIALANGGSALVGGDTIFAASTHSEDVVGSISYLFSTSSIPVRLISCSTSAEPPTSVVSGAAVNITGVGTSDLTLRGLLYSEGMTFTANDEIFFGATTSSILTFKACTITAGVATGSSLNDIVFGGGTSTRHKSLYTFIDCVISHGAGAGTTALASSGVGNAHFIGCTGFGSGFAGTLIKDLSSSDRGTSFRFVGCNLSSYSGTLFSAYSSTGQIDMLGCLLHASLTIPAINDSFSVNIEQCGTENQYFNDRTATPQGSKITDTGIVLAATYDGTNKYAYNLECTTDTSPAAQPFRTELVTIDEVDFTSDVTFTVEFARDGSATAYQDDEVWIEVEYNDATNNALRVTDDSSKVGILATPVNLTSSTAAWTGLGGTNSKMKVATTIASASANTGPVRIFVCFATGLASTDLYADPAIVIT